MTTAKLSQSVLDDLAASTISPGSVLIADLRRFLSRRALLDHEVRYLVTIYFTIQRHRIAMDSSLRASTAAGRPSATIETYRDSLEAIEDAMVPMLKRWAASTDRGRWALSIAGIGPVIAAGMCAFATLSYCRDPHNLWSYAGLIPGDPTRFSRSFRRIAYYAGESFVRAGKYYRNLYVQRKAYEWRKNLSGGNREQALAAARKAVAPASRAFLSGDVDPEKLLGYMALGKSPVSANGAIARAVISPGAGIPMLTPGHIDRRARRWTIKMFISHFSQVSWESTSSDSDEPWQPPYAVRTLGHDDLIPPPNWPMQKGWKDDRALAPVIYPEYNLQPLIDVLEK